MSEGHTSPASPQHSDGDGGEARAMRVGALPVATEQEDLLYFLAASARTLSLCSAYIAPSLTTLRRKLISSVIISQSS